MVLDADVEISDGKPVGHEQRSRGETPPRSVVGEAHGHLGSAICGAWNDSLGQGMRAFQRTSP
ncbi:hypothetical protein RESH_01013 [Rhodopirellula europaea SH398]|uniref:Uncharacterized protein n=1 Tax=Rhodopirellula europaea SH398 TaxID=1263868 RepID=M5S9U8_9BACT|nr:hypothetical protein RESH_01013 [Rhodopirellula europaea SH398]